MDSLNVMTFNSTGLGESKRQFIKELLDDHKPELMFLQETWLLTSNLATLGSIHESYLFCGTSAVPEGSLVKGRPFGGVAVLWRKDIAESVTVVKNINCARICSVELKGKLHGNERDFILINVYCPVDNRRKSHVDDDLLGCFDAIDQLMERYPNHCVILGGDMNMDLRRGNAHDKFLRCFCSDKGLQDVWLLEKVDLCETYSDYFNDSASCIDRFVVSQCLAPLVTVCKTCDYADNPSNHSPVSIDVSVSLDYSNVLKIPHVKSTTEYIA